MVRNPVVMMRLLDRALDRLKLINGDDTNCICNAQTCPNHSLIHEIEEFLKPEEK